MEEKEHDKGEKKGSAMTKSQHQITKSTMKQK